MSRKINIKDENVELRYANWLKQAIDLISPKNLYLVAGRGTGKTSDVLAERSQDIIYDMPGGSFALVADTYINLQKNIVKTFLEGWERKGWREYSDRGIGHFVVDRKPPTYYKQPFTRLESYKHVISVFNGCNITLVSMDRPSSGAGNNYLHLFGDEAKYLKEAKLKKLTPAIRGDYIRFGHSPFYRGRTFTTDYPDPNSIYEDDWILRMVKNMDKKQIRDILECAFVLNDIRIEYLQAEKAGDTSKLKNISRSLERWESRYNKIRRNSTLFYIATSFVNADILTEGYFLEQFAELEPEDYQATILSMKRKLEEASMFYGNLAEKHFYADGYNYDYYDRFGLRDNISENCRGLKYLRVNEKLELGVDFGNMVGMTIGQEQWPYYRILKNMFVLPPQYIQELANNFLDFFEPHKHKEVDLYYDRSGNNFNRQKQDLATKLKNAIEKRTDNNGHVKSTGWKVNLMSVGQGNITHTDEYDLMNDMLTEKNPGLPKLLIDQFECKEYKSSLEMAPLEKDTKGNIKKVKKSEKLPVRRLPMESTNMSDAGKYLLCRKKYLDVVKSRRSISFGDPGLRG
jgi:hypothetical protein